MKNYAIILLVLLISLSSCKTEGQNNSESAKNFPAVILTIDSISAAETTINNIPSLAVGIVKDGKIVMQKAYGFADVKNRIKADSSTIYQLGSVTKTFTGHLLSHFIVKGKLKLTDSLAAFFSEVEKFPAGINGEFVSVKDIATHSAQFPRYPENLERVDPDPVKGFMKADLYKGIELVKIDTMLGVEYYYSNFGYGVLGTAMENLERESLGNLMEQYIFKALKMQNTSLYMNEKIKNKLAIPYLEIEPVVTTEPWEMESLAGAGNLFSNVMDLNSFMIQLMEKNDVNSIQQQPYLKVNETWNYGLGCFVINSEKKNTKIIYHGGDIDGYASSLTLYPEFDLGVVILTNYGEGRVVSEIFRKITDAAFNGLAQAKE